MYKYAVICNVVFIDIDYCIAHNLDLFVPFLNNLSILDTYSG